MNRIPNDLWAQVRGDYAAGETALSALAAKYGLKPGTVRSRARREGWRAAERTKPRGGTDEKKKRPGAEKGPGKKEKNPPPEGPPGAGTGRPYGNDSPERPAEDGPRADAEPAPTLQNAADLLLRRICGGVRDGSLADSSRSVKELTAALKDLAAVREEKNAGALRVVFGAAEEYAE